MGHLVNQKEAMEFVLSIDDGVVGRLVGEAYTTVLHSGIELDGDFDMLFFSKVLAEFLKDREERIRNLQGEFAPNPFDLSDAEAVIASAAATSD